MLACLALVMGVDWLTSVNRVEFVRVGGGLEHLR
jgi:hypothetical protein